MKKILCVMIVVSLLLCSACSNGSKNDNDSKNNNDSKQVEKADDDVTSDVILPAVEVSTANWDGVYKKLALEGVVGFQINEKIGDYYFGYKHEKDSDSIESMVFDTNSNKFIKFKYPENIPVDDIYFSSDIIVLKNKYIYRWISYKSEDSQEDTNVLTCIDVETGKAKIIDEEKSEMSESYLYIIDDTHFLSYYVNRTMTDTIGSECATIYDIDGNKKEIIKEKYESNSELPDSKGNLIGYFDVNNDKIYKLGISKVDGKYKSSLYNYNLNGDLLNEKEVVGLNDIMDDYELTDLSIVEDYIIFRKRQDTTFHICKMKDDGVELIAKGVSYVVSDKYIYFMRNDMYKGESKIDNRQIPLYGLNIDSGKISAFNFPVFLEEPNNMRQQSLLNKDLLFSYIGSDMLSPKSVQFIFSKDKLNSLFDKCE